MYCRRKHPRLQPNARSLALPLREPPVPLVVPATNILLSPTFLTANALPLDTLPVVVSKLQILSPVVASTCRRGAYDQHVSLFPFFLVSDVFNRRRHHCRCGHAYGGHICVHSVIGVFVDRAVERAKKRGRQAAVPLPFTPSKVAGAHAALIALNIAPNRKAIAFSAESLR